MNALRRRRYRAPLGAAAACVCLALGCQRAPRALSPQDFEARLRDLAAKRDFAAAESLINDRERQSPGDAEVYVGRGNLYFLMARPGDAGVGVAADSAAAPGLDTLAVSRAVAAIGEGIRRHPERLDIRFGLAFIHQQTGNPASEIAVLREAVDYARQHPDAVRWLYGDPLPLPPDQYVPTALRDYVRFYLDRGAPGDEGPMLDLARLSAEAYPSYAQTTNEVALFYGSRGDWRRSLEFLQQAEQADSSNPTVLYNLGLANENLGHRSQATRYYHRAATAGDAGQPDIAKSARDRLARLGERTP